jgi:hypothetical protein
MVLPCFELLDVAFDFAATDDHCASKWPHVAGLCCIVLLNYANELFLRAHVVFICGKYNLYADEVFRTLPKKSRGGDKMNLLTKFDKISRIGLHTLPMLFSRWDCSGSYESSENARFCHYYCRSCRLWLYIGANPRGRRPYNNAR